MLTYTESDKLMQDIAFRGRIKIACLTYADYIVNEATSAVAHNTRNRWATECYKSPDMAASQVQPAVVMDGAVREQGDKIVDADLQTVVETAVNKLM